MKPAGHDSTIEGMKLNGAGGTSNIGPRIYADGVTLRDNEITNSHTSICVQVGSWYDGPAPRGVVIERNRIHDCGELPSTNKDHGVYLSEARDAIVRDNWIYDNVDRGVQQYSHVDGARITGNVIFNNGEGVNYSGGSNQIVEGNIIANSRFRRNVYAGSTGSPGDGVLRNNCVYASSGDTGNGGIESSNVFSEAGNLIAKPGFVDPAAGDFRLKPGDSCLAKYTGTMSLPDGSSPPPPPPPSPSPPPASGSATVTLQASSRSVRVGGTLKLRGRALGAHSGRAVIRKRHGHRWQRVRATKIRNGHFALRLRARTRKRALKFRARVGRLGQSRTVRVRVQR